MLGLGVRDVSCLGSMKRGQSMATGALFLFGTLLFFLHISQWRHYAGLPEKMAERQERDVGFQLDHQLPTPRSPGQVKMLLPVLICRMGCFSSPSAAGSCISQDLVSYRRAAHCSDCLRFAFCHLLSLLTHRRSCLA